MQSIAHDLGIHYTVHILTDASAAIGIVRRRGLGRVRHLDVTDLWVQQKIRNNDVTIQKIPGQENMADALTKIMQRPLMVKHLTAMGLFPETGRAESAPKIG